MKNATSTGDKLLAALSDNVICEGLEIGASVTALCNPVFASVVSLFKNGVKIANDAKRDYFIKGLASGLNQERTLVPCTVNTMQLI